MTGRVDAPVESLDDLQPGLTTPPGRGGRLALVGRKCEDCGARFFPARARCVACYRGNLSVVELERLGNLDTFTIVRQGPPGYLGPVPYVLGMIVVGNDVQILAHLIGKPVEAWRRGETVAACSMTLPGGPERKARLTYAFRPAGEDDLNEL